MIRSQTIRITDRAGTNTTTIVPWWTITKKRDDQEESNVVSKRDQQDTSHPFELEVDALCMAQEMQTMKEKMDMMMSALKG